MIENKSLCEYALDYARRGWAVLPCKPSNKAPFVPADLDEHGEKIPNTGGLYKATCDPDVIRDWWQTWPHAMIGIRMGKASGVWALDPDKPDEPGKPDGMAAWSELQAKHGACPATHTHRSPRGGRHLLFKWRADRAVTTSPGQLKPTGIDVRGEGGYIIAPPSARHDGKLYEIEDPLDFFNFAEAPDWLYELILKRPEREPATISQLALASVQPREPRSTRRYAEAALDGEYQNVASATPGTRNEQLNTSAMKLGQLVAGGHLAESQAIDSLYQGAVASGLVASDGHRAAVATIQSGFRKGLTEPRRIPDGQQQAQREEREEEQAPPVLRIIDPATWEGQSVPPREWIVQDMIPAGTVSLLMGDGAAGKTTLALQLATARALGRDWIGTIPSDGRTLFLSAEDDENELHRRLDAIRQHYNATFADLAGRLRLIDLVGEDAVLGALQRNGIIRATPLLSAVEEQIKGFRPDLAVVDALADAFAGEENNRAQARQFIGLLKRLARDYRTAFLCLAHPSLYGMNSGAGTSGSTGWSNSVRSRLYFETAKASSGEEPDPDLRQLSLKKSNYGPPGHSITVRWKSGVYVPESGGSSLDRLALQQKAQEVFMSLLRTFGEQGQHVSPSKSSTYAPAKMAKHPKAAGIGAKHLESAMQELLDRKMIKIETFGPPSKPRQRLVSYLD